MYVVGSGAGGLWNSCVGRAIRIPGRKPQYLRIESGNVYFLPFEPITKIWEGNKLTNILHFHVLEKKFHLPYELWPWYVLGRVGFRFLEEQRSASGSAGFFEYPIPFAMQ
jgi:hypothetical protein